MAPMMGTVRPGEPAMEWMIAPSADERARGRLLPESLSAAHAAFRKHGCLLLPGVFPTSLIDAMHQDYVYQFVKPCGDFVFFPFRSPGVFIQNNP